MFRRMILMPRRRYFPPSNTALFIPGRGQVSIGRSPNLIAWNGTAPSTGWTAANATLSDEATIVYRSLKSLKLLDNGTYCSAAQSNAGYAKYLGITAKLDGAAYALSTNAREGYLSIYDNLTTGPSANLAKDSAWHTYSATKRIAVNATALTVNLRGNFSGTANTTDITYFDVPDLYVSQIVLPNGQIVYSDQSGIGSNGLMLFDGIDDLVILMQSTQWDGTGAFSWMGRILPTGWGGGGLGHILSNGKLIFSIVNAKLQVTSDGSTTVSSAVSSLSLNVKQWIGLTRLANGTVNFYTEVNGLPTLSGTADQASGTPVAGGNLIGGNRVAGDRGFAGNPFDNSVLMLRIATQAEMTQHITGTRYS